MVNVVVVNSGGNRPDVGAIDQVKVDQPVMCWVTRCCVRSPWRPDSRPSCDHILLCARLSIWS